MRSVTNVVLHVLPCMPIDATATMLVTLLLMPSVPPPEEVTLQPPTQNKCMMLCALQSLTSRTK